MQRDFHIRIFTYPGSNFDTKWTGRKILTGFIEAKASGHRWCFGAGDACSIASSLAGAGHSFHVATLKQGKRARIFLEERKQSLRW